MNTLESKPSQKVPFLILLGVVLLGIPLTVFALQQTQIFQQFAWGTEQSAEAICSTENGGAVVKVSFTNTERSKAMDVVVTDIQSGKTVDLGTVNAKETKEGEIITESQTLEDGGVKFDLTWTDGTSGKDSRTATYKGVSECAPPPPFCPANPDINRGTCKWDALEGAEGYDVVVTDKETGEPVKNESVGKDTTETTFVMTPGKAYTCKVTPVNACGKGVDTESPEKICTVPTPTPTVSPTPPVCPEPPLKNGVCKWDALEGATEYKITIRDADKDEIIKTGTVKAPDTSFQYPANPTTKYQCIVTAVNKCSEAPPVESPPISCVQPSPTPTLPGPTPTPTTPSPTPTPTVVPPTATPIPPTPTPTVPAPTPTPIVIVRVPTYITQPPVQQPPVQQPPVQQQQPPVVVQQPPVVVRQPGQVIQQPGQTVVIQPTLAPGQPSPVPTMKPTGSVSNSVMLVSASVVLLIAGTLVFFIL